MTPAEARIVELYRAFNSRDFDAFFDMLAPQVNWSNDIDDSRLIGKDALRTYILDETAQVRAEFAPIHIQALDDDRVGVLTQQIILSKADGGVWSDTRVRHTFTLADDRVIRLDVERDVRDVDPSTVAVLTSLYEAIDAQDVDAVVALFHPDARIPDSLEQGEVVGHDEIRAHYLRLFATIHVGSSLLSALLLPDGRIEANLHVQVRGVGGGSWGEGAVTATYRLDGSRITEMIINKSLVG